MSEEVEQHDIDTIVHRSTGRKYMSISDFMKALREDKKSLSTTELAVDYVDELTFSLSGML